MQQIAFLQEYKIQILNLLYEVIKSIFQHLVTKHSVFPIYNQY